MKLSTTKRTLLGLVALAGTVYGCRDFLVTPPQGQLDELTLQNRQGVEATLVGAYRMLGGHVPGMDLFGAAPSNWIFGSVASDDAHKGSEPGDGPQATDIEIYNWNTGGAQATLNGKWRAVYEGVSRANATLRLLQRVRADRPGEISDADANSIRGEALVLRAHQHFEAWKFWGNVPYYVETDGDFRKPNIPSQEVVAAMVRDLDEAISLLPTTPRAGQAGRVSQWTAKAYKGRVQVYAGDYAAGLATLREVANANVYNLEPNFHRVWTGFFEFHNGPETILAYQASVNDGAPDGENANFGERLNFPHAGSPFGCCGFHQPTQNLVNFFRVDASGLPLAIGQGDLTPLSATQPWNAGHDAEFEAGNMAPVDPRLDWTVGRDGVPYKDWGAHAANWIRDPSFGGPYSPKKNVHEQASGAQSNAGWNPQHLNAVNFHLYRYADLLLLLAEAEVEAGSIENAREIVNRIRRRAGAAAQGPGTSAGNIAVPLNDPSITWASYRVGEYPSFPNQDYARSAVRYERRLELAMEGHRFFDLRRWGVAKPVLDEYVQVERTRRPHLAAASPLEPRHRWYPIPTVQIELTRSGDQRPLEQNEGW